MNWMRNHFLFPIVFSDNIYRIEGCNFHLFRFSFYSRIWDLVSGVSFYSSIHISSVCSVLVVGDWRAMCMYVFIRSFLSLILWFTYAFVPLTKIITIGTWTNLLRCFFHYSPQQTLFLLLFLILFFSFSI